jgi:hypothetical protein
MEGRTKALKSFKMDRTGKEKNRPGPKTSYVKKDWSPVLDKRVVKR